MEKIIKITKKKSLKTTIFITTLLVGSLIYTLCSTMFVNQLYNYFEGRIFNELETEAEFLNKAISTSGTDFITQIYAENRITLINSDGKVFYDNKIPLPTLSNIENHNSRIEIIEAREKGFSKTSRYSDTLLQKTLYFAVKTDNDDIIRISCQQHSIRALLLEMKGPLLFLLIITVIVSLFVASLISKKICDSINKINLDDPQNANIYKELTPFIKRITEENFEKDQRATLRQQFTANVSHELKTPLTSISGFAEILKDGVKDDSVDKKTIIDFSSSIYDESQRMITLVNDIIKLSKLDEESISEEKEDISLREITKEAIETIHSTAKKKGITFILTGDSGNIEGVPSVIFEMIFNLCDNAVKYNKEGGQVFIKINTDLKEKLVSISIRDTGIGICEKEKERIFERFYRVDKSRSKELGGTGLGLSIVKHGARYHEASVEVISKENSGTEFILTFKGRK